MQSQWVFHFECEGFTFGRSHKYKAPIAVDHAQAFGLPESAFEALIDIEPDSESKNPLCEQTGKLKITLPGRQEQTSDLAYWLGRRVVQQISFSQQAKMRIHYGLVLGELIPETPHEAEGLGKTDILQRLS